MSKKLLTFLTLLTLFFGVGWAATETFTLTGGSGSNATTYSQTPITLSFDKGQGTNAPKSYSESVRFYNKNTLSISTTSGTITKVVLTYTTSQYSLANSECTTNSGSYNYDDDYTEGTWTGSASSITITSSKSSQARISKVVVTYTPSSVATYNVTGTGQTTGGTVTADPTGGVEGTSITITATPDNGYELETLIVDDNDVTNSVNSDYEYTFSMPSHDVAVSATFSAISQGNVEWVLTSPSALTTGDVVLIVDKYSSRAMSNDKGTSTAPAATSVTLNSGKDRVTAGASDNLQWSVTNTNGTFQFAVPGTTNYLYNGTTNNSLRVGTGSPNTYSMYTSTEEYNSGVEFLATNNNRYVGVYNNSDWRCYDNITGNIKDTEIAFYKRVQTGAHSITVDEDIEHGEVTTDEQSGSQGDVITITVDPDDGYELTALAYNNTPITPTAGNDVSTYTFTMPDADVEITATFSLINYTITTSATNGTVTTNPSGTATMGQTITVTATPSSGYKVNTITYTPEGGTAVEITPVNGAYTFEMPAANVTVTATFIDDNKLYILGMINGNGIQPNQGVRMDYDGTKYTANIWVIGNTSNEMGISGSWFAFTTVLANDNDDGGWSYVNANRYEPKPTNNQGTEVGDSYWWLANGDNCVNTNIELANRYWVNAFLIPAGLYTVEVTPGTTWKFSLTEIKDFTPTITPEGGDVVLGTTSTASISENFNTFIASCNPVVQANGNTVSITPPVARFYVNNDLVNGTSKEITLDAVGETTVSGKCALYVNGNDEYAAKTASETYNVYRTYSATIASGITGGTVAFNAAGTNTTLNDLTEDYEVRVYVSPNNDYALTSLTYTVEGSSTPVSITNNAGDYYTFRMPAGNVTINAIFSYNGPVATTTTYALIKSLDDFEENAKYLIVHEDGNKAQALGGTGKAAFETTITNHEAEISSNSDISQFVLGGTSGAWTFKNGSGYLQNYGTNAQNVNQTGSGNDDASKWTISSIDSETGNVELVNNSTNRRLRYYNSDFRAYATNTSYGEVIQLYKETTPSLQAPTISPEGGTFLNSEYPQGVTVTISCSNDDADIYYTTDGTEPSASNGTPIESGNTITVTTTTTVQAIAILGDESSEVVSETYSFTDVLIDPVVFSPIPGTYSGAQTLEMFSVNQNAKIYYTTDGSTPSATNGTLYSSSDVINLAVGNTYNFKAIAVLGNNCSNITDGTYVINSASTSALNSVAELNASDVDNSYNNHIQQHTMGNPVQVIYMNTWRHKDGTVQGTNTVSTVIPEYAYIRDNTGYSMVYFGNGWYNTWNGYAVDDIKICQMGDWIPGNKIVGSVQVWSDGFHNELGGKNQYTTITSWPTNSDVLTNTPIIPEEMTNANINAGWKVPDQVAFATAFNNAFQQYCTNNNLDPENLSSSQESAANEAGRDAACGDEGYLKYVQDGNVWGHYVHLRKNTIRVTNITNADDAIDGATANDQTATRKKYSGFITDQSGDELTYYDAFYNFSGFNGTPNYSNDYFQEKQDNGATFDVYAIVGFYGPKAADVNSNYSPFEVFPIDFKYIYKPIINIDNVAYSDHDPITALDTKTVTLTCATEGATIWYKTSDMEDYEEYIPGTTEIIVDNTTTIETYSSIGVPEYNDMMESVVNSLTINMGNIEAPFITEPSVVKTVGESVTTTITCETAGVTIYYTTDGSDPKTSATRQAYSSALTFDETTTVRAIAYKEVEGTGYYSAEALARTYTFVKSNGIKYNLVTDQTQLNESSVYVIVNKANNMAVGTTQNETNRSADGVMFVDDTKTQVYGNDELAQFTLKKVGNKWYMQTLNGSVTGYLYVGNGNTLLTGAATDAAEATINIDADAEHQAHISFVYNNETTRYLRYWNGGQAFSTYTSETSNLPVSLYYTVATPLANIEKEGVVGNQYTIADELIAVHVLVKSPEQGAVDQNDYVYLWCKDQGNVSISKTEKTGNDQIDYLKDVTGVQKTDWDQSNWVILKFIPTYPDQISEIEGAVNHYIKPATITGHYTDGVNFTITMPEGEGLPDGALGGDVTYTPNVYCPVNFLDDNLNINGGEGPMGAETQEHYFFMNPKVQEVATVTYAVWNGSCFVIPAKAGGNNQGDFDGAFNVGWTYNKFGNREDYLQKKAAYRFLAVLNTVDTNTGNGKGAKADDSEVETVEGKECDPQPGKMVYALDLQGDDETQIVTSIKEVIDVTDKTVAGVKYYNLAGIESDRPFEGVNIIVTTYTDGSRSSSKVLK